MTDARFPIAVISAFADAATSIGEACTQLGARLRVAVAAAAPNPPPAPVEARPRAAPLAPVEARPQAAPLAPVEARPRVPPLAPVEDVPIVAGGVPVRAPRARAASPAASSASSVPRGRADSPVGGARAPRPYGAKGGAKAARPAQPAVIDCSTSEEEEELVKYKKPRTNAVADPARGRVNFVRVRAVIYAPGASEETRYYNIVVSRRVQVEGYPFWLEAMSLTTVDLATDDDEVARWVGGADWAYDKKASVIMRLGTEGGSFKHASLGVTVDVDIVDA